MPLQATTLQGAALPTFRRIQSSTDDITGHASKELADSFRFNFSGSKRINFGFTPNQGHEISTVPLHLCSDDHKISTLQLYFKPRIHILCIYINTKCAEVLHFHAIYVY